MVWWHERGHQIIEEKTGLQSRFTAIKEDIFFLLICCAAAQERRLFLIGCTFYLLPRLAFELIAWLIALKHKKEWI
jgi:hypothetical protein